MAGRGLDSDGSCEDAAFADASDAAPASRQRGGGDIGGQYRSERSHSTSDSGGDRSLDDLLFEQLAEVQQIITLGHQRALDRVAKRSRAMRCEFVDKETEMNDIREENRQLRNQLARAGKPVAALCSASGETTGGTGESMPTKTRRVESDMSVKSVRLNSTPVTVLPKPPPLCRPEAVEEPCDQVPDLDMDYMRVSDVSRHDVASREAISGTDSEDIEEAELEDISAAKRPPGSAAAWGETSVVQIAKKAATASLAIVPCEIEPTSQADPQEHQSHMQALKEEVQALKRAITGKHADSHDDLERCWRPSTISTPERCEENRDRGGPGGHNAVFADAAAMKEKLRAAIGRPQYNVSTFYHKTGWAQRLAKDSLFDMVTLTVIAMNSLWIAVDTDYNKSESLYDAHPVFICAENFFCLYFSFEIFVRFMAFKVKTNTRKDAWFVFDATLVSLMVFETWLMTLMVVASGGGSGGLMGNASILRLFRLLRLSRMARMARLLRAMPELMVMIKGMTVAMRSVFFTLCLLMGILYVFAIGFVQLLGDDSTVGDRYFRTVPEAINSLLLGGVLPDQSELIADVGGVHLVYRFCILLYVLFASMTVMNMLVGVLCEVVSVVSSVEKETLLINYVRGQLQHMMETSGLDADGNKQISRSEFNSLLQNSTAARALQDVGVDVVGLVDFTDFIFKDGKELTFSDFMDVVLQLRGSNTATVKDMVDLRKMIMSELKMQDERLDEKIGYMIGTLNRRRGSTEGRRTLAKSGYKQYNSTGSRTSQYYSNNTRTDSNTVDDVEEV